MEVPEHETAERRDHTRRSEDVQRIATLVSLAGVLIACGMAWATATAAVTQKVGRDEFARYTAEVERRFQADSIDRSHDRVALRRIEIKVDSTNERLSRLICERAPSYCR